MQMQKYAYKLSIFDKAASAQLLALAIFAFILFFLSPQQTKANEILDAAAQNELAAFLISETPKELPTTPFKDEQGNELNLQNWKGKTILVNLWATFCAPCRHEMPDLDALQGQLGDENFEVVTISLDRGDIKKPKKFFEEIGIENLKLYHDDRGKIFNSFRRISLARGLPFTVLIGPDGKDMGYLNGPAAWASQDAVHLIETAKMINKQELKPKN